MVHNYLENSQNSAHWSSGTDSFGSVLVQLGDATGEQVRIKLTTTQARMLAHKILKDAELADNQEPLDENI